MLFYRQPASAMGMPTPVTSTSTCGRRQGIEAVVSATTVSTTLKDSTVSAVSWVSTVTSGDPSLPQMLAKVSMVPKVIYANKTYLTVLPFAGPREKAYEILRQYTWRYQLIYYQQEPRIFKLFSQNSLIFMKGISLSPPTPPP